MEEQPSTTSESTTRNKKLACVFCGHVEKKVGKRRLYVTIPQKEATVTEIKEMAESSRNSSLIKNLEDFPTVAYHSDCFTALKTTLQRQNKEKAEPGHWHANRQLHQSAFAVISDVITMEIIEKNRVMFLCDLFSQYKALLLEFGENKVKAEDFHDYRAENLENKIINSFGDRLIIEPSSAAHRKKIVYQFKIDTSQLAGEIANLEEKQQNRHRDVAYELRNSITSVENKKLPADLSVDDVIRGECTIPEELFNFVCDLVQGPDIRRKNSNEDLVKIKSVCSDLIYIVSKGRVKPSKHLTLGLAMKSITSSRKVLSILNRYGHTIGYNLAEEIETEMTYATQKDESLVPSGIRKVNGLSTHVAFDNFDRFVDTATGKDTLHDTVGIIYQFNHRINEESGDMEILNCSTSQSNDDNIESHPPRKRRRYEGIPQSIRTYYKKPLTSMPFVHVDSITQTIDACQFAKIIAMDKDYIWSMSLSRIDSLPMWLGYNCKICIDCSKTQTVEYLPPINSSPTSLAVVYQTLCTAKEIAKNCDQEQIIVTYDLAIAKLAMQIQLHEKPEFDNVFVNLGAFHMQMAYFKAIGKYIDSSGLVEILVQAEALAGGSMVSFLDSKHFNRCKRLHPLASGALQVLHFEKYLSEKQYDPDTLNEDLAAVINTPSEDNERIILQDSLQQILEDYKQYRETTLQGGHGKTAQYYLLYSEMINIYHRFSRSIRCSNLELYLNSIFEICDYFFAFNLPNYSKWAALYLNNLIKLKMDDSALIAEFRQGAFGVRRTNSCLGRSPVDLTLEQTINADAGNTLTGVSHFTNSIAARQRWALSHSIRTKILSAVKAEVGLSRADDTSHSLQKNQIEKDNKTLNRIIETMKKTTNPFSENLDKNILFNMSTGKAASSHVSDFLLNCKTLGHEQKLRFFSECSEDPTRFVKSIKRNVISNFASDCAKRTIKNKSKDNQALLKMERDIFGRLLAIAIEHKVDIENCLSYPLAPVPPALFHCTGHMYKTDKSTLSKHLKSKIEVSNPGHIDVEIIDGFYYLYSIGSTLPQSFGKVAEAILIKLCSTNSQEIHIIFDRYLTPSIKDCERLNRAEIDIPYTISGPLQPRPKDFLASLKNYRFKEALVKFLADHWSDNSFAAILKNKKVFITVDELCFSFSSVGNIVLKNEEPELACLHEEADTRIIFHISKIHDGAKILVKATDTDILIILLGNIHKFANLQIWLANSTSKKTTNQDQACINCTKLSVELGPTLCLALPAFHAFTGCDYTAAFFNKGKVRPFKIFCKHQNIQETFASLSNPEDILDDNKMIVVQEFIALMYGIKNCQNVNAARLLMFNKMYAMTTINDKFMKKLKGFNSSTIPPCLKSLQQKLLRTIFVNSMWQNATTPDCIRFKPENNGWILDETLKPTWFIGDSMPQQVEDVICDLIEQSSEDTNDKDSDVSTYESDSSDDSSDDST